ncbi:MAG: aldehyde ferredoxin oxidoreductase family protein [Anaerolineaceae bacterium]|nr:aldehyde ferredoxin oxidoreductase family protein [Anaerolineaceae bacterium]
MPFGTPGKILHVNLTESSFHIEELPEEFYRLYPGGKALAGYYLLHEIPAHADPLGPDNVIVFACGLLCGAPISTAARFTVAARSPLTGAYGESEAGGFWGPELKFAGFEAILIKGRAAKPVYLWISDGNIEIRDAQNLWGHEPADVQSKIRAELGDNLIRVLQIGLGGENLVHFASITNELRHFNGRTGMGAVMGSKNLKAIAVRGHGRYSDFANDSASLQSLGRKFVQDVKTNPISWGMHEQGTLGLVDALNNTGMMPTKNFHMGSFEGASKINWQSYSNELLIGRQSCYACSVRCKREVEVTDRYQVSKEYGGPEYETVAGFGSNCGISDIQAIAKANELCDRYTLDTISTSGTIAFAMECFENGLIGLEETGGVELRFGNTEAMLQMIDRIAHRQGIGDLLSKGSKCAAQTIGKGSIQFTIQVKGQELALHDPRGKVGVGLGYAISETGADHLVSIHDPSLSNPESFTFKSAKMISDTVVPLPPADLSDQKVANFWLFENWISCGKTIGFCFFGPSPRSYMLAPDVLAAVHFATGWDITIEELLRIGERGTTLARMFNLREGFTPKDDMLPARLFEPLENGPLAGKSISKNDFDRALHTLYRIKDWDPETGIPAANKLHDLGLSWSNEYL